ncbi:hypothetical protein D3C76_1116580 [compost metagenome]
MPGQRYAMHDRPELPGYCRCHAPAGMGRCDRCHELRGPARADRRVRCRNHRAQAAPGHAAGRHQPACVARRQRSDCPEQGHSHPGCLEHSLDSAGARCRSRPTATRDQTDRNRTQQRHRQPAGAGHCGQLPRGVPGQPPRPVRGHGRGPAGDCHGGNRLDCRTSPGPLDQPARQRLAGVPGGQPGGELRDDDRAIRRRFAVRGKPPAGATGGAG